MTNSVTVAMTINGTVRYAMRLLFNRCHGNNPIICAVAESGEGCEFEELEFFINKCLKSYNCRYECLKSCKLPLVNLSKCELNGSSHIVKVNPSGTIQCFKQAFY